ncbi:MAG: siroheme synthase [Paludibacter sp. 47-17]|nr:MAG: siroheme synthase [Paludibacter sp. SCN 50-10]ODU61961.1 MAG: siroheme synthase [Paludibacter sp. SCN 51-9]OJX92437.1 MAG: siroheme synthase [Paludibacter sp. 47-17]
MQREDLRFLPVSINVTGKKILLIGGGKVATHKAGILARFVTENVTVLSPDFTPEMCELPFHRIQKTYEPTDLEGFFLVYVCTGDHALNEQIKADAGERGILTSVCDAPILCDFVSPAIFKHDHLTIAVSSNAQNVYQSIAVRDRIAQLSHDGILQLNQP